MKLHRRGPVLALCFCLCLLPAALHAEGPSPMSAGVPLDAAHFPDPHLRGEMTKRDTNQDGILSAQETEKIVAYTADADTTTLKGIEYLPNLHKLTVDNSRLTSIDLSGNPELHTLSMKGLKNLDSLTVPVLPALDELNCSDTNMNGKLDLSKFPNLNRLDCDNIGCSTIQLGALPKLDYLSCRYNHLTSLDLSRVPLLGYLDCSENDITELDLRSTPEVYTVILDIDKRDMTVTLPRHYFCKELFRSGQSSRYYTLSHIYPDNSCDQDSGKIRGLQTIPDPDQRKAHEEYPDDPRFYAFKFVSETEVASLVYDIPKNTMMGISPSAYTLTLKRPPFVLSSEIGQDEITLQFSQYQLQGTLLIASYREDGRFIGVRQIPAKEAQKAPGCTISCPGIGSAAHVRLMLMNSLFLPLRPAVDVR